MAKNLDKVTLEIIWGKLQATADEMGVVLAKASMSPVIYEVLDFACGLCDSSGEMIVVQNGITIFTGTFSDDVKAVKDKFENDIAEGDIFVFNDPHKSGTHLNDISVIKPIFSNSKIVAFAIADAHWADIGGSVPGSTSPQATDIYQEGLQLPGVKLFKSGVIQSDIIDIISANVRFEKMAIGDLNAEVASVNIAEKRIQEIIKKYGDNYLLASFEYLKNYGEKVACERIKKMPNGIYSVSDLIDGDGFNEAQIPINLKMSIKDQEIIFDFSGTAKETKSPLKCGKGALFSMVKAVFKAVVDPHSSSNEGWFRPLKVVVPEGTVFSATYPNSTGWYFEVASQAADLVCKAFAKVNPSTVAAGSYVSLSASFIYGSDPRNKKQFMIVEPHAGGWGATDNSDGASGLIAILDGDTYNYSIELFEAKFPLRVKQYAYNVEGGVGHGKFRGGFGLIREYEVLGDDIYTYCNIGRSIAKPWGLEGGHEGSNNFMIISSNGTLNRVTRTSEIKLNKGDYIKIVTGGGGGYGDPRERPKSMISDDLENGFIDSEVATLKYQEKN